ncbi:MAG TPA: M48 family metalloprotease [Thermodesulfovibrionia bacterium]|nr:M48 family metalloprotease [Thermodesulfovibrionia bacterium]
MQFCTQCGTKNDDDARYCNLCGQELSSGEGHKKTAVNRKLLWAVAGIAALLAIAVTVWHLKGNQSPLSKSDTQKQEPADTKEEQPGGGEEDTDSQQKASEVVGDIFGSDEEVGSTAQKPVPLKKGLKDVDKAKDYNYTHENCNTLYTDVFQQGAYSIEQELLEVTKMSAQEENETGREIAQNIADQFQGALDVDKAWVDYVRKLGKQIVARVDRKGIDYHFHVISDDTVNAFAVPGGGVYFFTGILNTITNEAQLAGIIAHEVKHVDLRHCIALFQVLSRLPEAAQNPITFSVAQTMKHPYSSRQEADADRKGLELIYSFSYSPYQVVQYWQQEMAKEEAGSKEQENNNPFGRILGEVGKEIDNVLLTHPTNQKRACLLKNHCLKLQEKYPMDTGYVGKWNYKNKKPMFEKQN